MGDGKKQNKKRKLDMKSQRCGRSSKQGAKKVNVRYLCDHSIGQGGHGAGHDEKGRKDWSKGFGIGGCDVVVVWSVSTVRFPACGSWHRDSTSGPSSVGYRRELDGCCAISMGSIVLTTVVGRGGTVSSWRVSRVARQVSPRWRCLKRR